MVFGLKKLQDQIFCLTEERDFFQGKYLEQVSEIVNLKEQLLQSRKEIARLRKELMENKNNTAVTFESPPKLDQEKDDDDHSTTASCSCSSSLTHTSDEVDAIAGEDENIRQSAEKLLQWASYRSSAYCSKSQENQQNVTDANSETPID